MCSGSHREGFRLKSSDIDTMIWLIHLKVIADISQSINYDLSKHFLILMENSDTSPGFVKLQLLSSPSTMNMKSALLLFNDGRYISNSRWRQYILSPLTNLNTVGSTKPHGPCANWVTQSVEIDYVLCFHSSCWSKLTDDWRKRCALHNWPPNYVLEDILRNGCHVVPVGSKIFTNENDLEWRMSFSLAEQNLVYSMNHKQFLCYGLLKIFLKEVVNRDIEKPFLCSYFVKTTLFWLIQIGHIKCF